MKVSLCLLVSFQFLGIPPKGEHAKLNHSDEALGFEEFPISRDPPEGGTLTQTWFDKDTVQLFPISRDPPEGGTLNAGCTSFFNVSSFQFLGIPPKGEPPIVVEVGPGHIIMFPISRDPPEGGTTWPLLFRYPHTIVSNF